MKKPKKLISYTVLALLSCALMGNTTNTGHQPNGKKKPQKVISKPAYDSTVQALRDSIAWYRKNWRLNEDLINKKHQLQNDTTCN